MRIITLIDDKQLAKKILKPPKRIKHKPPARANGPPTKTFIIYDESSSRSTRRLSTGYPIETYLRYKDAHIPASTKCACSHEKKVAEKRNLS